jgi:phospholipid N-methyltransferase
MNDSSSGLWRRVGQVGERLGFLGAFLKHPGTVGAVGPSSRFLARAMVEGCPLRDADTVVELGPGTGAFTRAILEAIGPETTFFALELNPRFVRGLERRFPQATFYNDAAENILAYLERHEKRAASHILSGLPWASLPLTVQERTLEAIALALHPGGSFTTFGYAHARFLPNAVRFHRRLERCFSSVRRSGIVWRNLPPAWVFRCCR